MTEGVRRALRDRAAKTPRGGLQVNLYPNTYYGFAIREDRRNQDERDRRASHAAALRSGLIQCYSSECHYRCTALPPRRTLSGFPLDQCAVGAAGCA